MFLSQSRCGERQCWWGLREVSKKIYPRKSAQLVEKWCWGREEAPISPPTFKKNYKSLTSKEIDKKKAIPVCYGEVVKPPNQTRRP
jgi:hypothetical protein